MRSPAMSVYFLACMMSGAMAQYGGGGATTTTSATKTVASSKTATSASSAASNIHSVAVGSGGLVFTPDTLTAAVGDIIEFTFVQGNSVERSTFAEPCNPIGTGSIYSGFPTSAEAFTIIVNDTNPIWLYCSQVSHCQNGMVMVVNPPSSSSNTLAAYKAAAQSATAGKDPASIQGGVIGPVGKAVSSASASDAVSSAAASTAAASSPSPTSAASFSREITWALVVAASFLWILRV